MNTVFERVQVRRQLARPMPLARRAAVTQDARGQWMCDGVVAQCPLGAHKDMAQAMAISHDVAALFAAATPAERERLQTVARAGFNSIEELWHRAVRGMEVFQ